ncbi:MAG: hypothetical protein K0R29_1377 [Pseudobdellovibrio sp.]|nr:hypothetical protein [Pseudobdellovibrio sp.]
MQTKFVENKINYDGSQLRPLYSYVNHKLAGDSIVAFEGSCNVSLDHMVDMEDMVVKAEIKSDHMLHFIVEMFPPVNLVAAVSLQRLLVAITQNILLRSGHNLQRRGDDLYWSEKKLSISIASCSSVSNMIHFGLNIENKGTPVPTCCLKDFGLDTKAFAGLVMSEFSAEYSSIVEATQKVKPL